MSHHREKTTIMGIKANNVMNAIVKLLSSEGSPYDVSQRHENGVKSMSARDCQFQV